MDEPKITCSQLKALFDFLMEDEREASFRYLIYDIMGFKPEDYCDLYSTGLMNFKDTFYEMRNNNKGVKDVLE